MFKTVRAKITVCFSVAIVFLFILFGITGYHMLRRYLIEMQQSSQERLAQSLCTAIAFFRQNCETTAMELISGPADRLRLDEVRTANSYIQDIYVINQAYETVGTGDPQKVRTYLIDRISTAERYEGQVVWDSGYDTASMMLFGKCLPREHDGNSYYLFLQVSNNQVLDLFNQFRLQNSQRFSLKGLTNGFEVTEQGFFYNYYDDYNELLHTEITMGDWHLRTWSDKSLILGSERGILRTMAQVLFAGLALAVLLSSILAFWITRPIKEMKETMERYGRGDFLAKVRVTGKDEIAGLAKLLNQMAEHISQLFERVREEEQQSRKLELQTLVYQINPHFLYNTLDSVNILARQSGDVKVAELVTDLSRLFRLGLHQGQEIVTVQEELMHVTYYLKIQKIRFDNQLTWEIDIDPQLLSGRIIKFILQPIVENAIYHGVKGKDEPGAICLSAAADGDFLEFCVTDTGNGMRAEALARLRERIRSDKMEGGEQKGYGMWNVSQRIKLFYGDSCGLEVESREGAGMTVKIRVGRLTG